MSDEYNHVPLKIVDHKELHPMGTAARIAELEAQIHAAGLQSDVNRSALADGCIAERANSLLPTSTSEVEAT